ncbi:MAG TPA: hypothetical protein VJ831_12870, partial [Jatrophihabitantaceae bacterium]|nr:hypothetical protein [Jatrophihabitantaceae bacterium]
LTYDGTIVDEPGFLVMGGQADAINTQLRDQYAAGLDVRGALALAVGALGSAGGPDGSPRALPAEQLEVAVLDRTRGKRKFRRLTGLALTELLPPDQGGTPGPPPPVDTPPHDQNGDGSAPPPSGTESTPPL